MTVTPQEVLKALSDPSIGAEVHRVVHQYSDKDQGDGALHHTLGRIDGQALPHYVADEDFVGTDGTVPNPPTGLTVTPSVYFRANGTAAVRVHFSWTAPPLNTDGSAFEDFKYYETQWRQNGDTAWTGTVQTDGNEVFYENFNPGDDIDLQVRVVDTSGNSSDWAQSLANNLNVDSSAPGTPSTPTLDNTKFFGMIRVTWDGLDDVGATMPADFARVEVHASTVSGFTPDGTTLRDTLFAAGVSDVFGDVGSTLYIKLVAYDTSENFSSPSAEVSSTILGVDTPDYINLSIVNANINDLSVSKITAGTLSADVTVSSRIKTADTGARSEMDSSGFHVYNGSGTEVAYLKIVAGVPALYISGGDISGGTITGSLFKTATSGQRLEIDSSFGNQLRFYTGNAYELSTDYGLIYANDVVFGGSTYYGRLHMYSPAINGSDKAYLTLRSETMDSAVGAKIQMTAGAVEITAGTLYTYDPIFAMNTVIADQASGAYFDGDFYYTSTIQDVDLTNDGQPITIGVKQASGTQLIIDNNEIQVRTRNGGNTAWSAGNLSLNANGGNVNLSGASQIGSATVQAYGQSVCVGPSSLTRPYEVNGDSASYTTNGSGQVTVNHGLGGTPTSVVAVSGNGSNSRWMAVDTLGASSFRVTVFNTGGTVNGVSVPIKWIAFR